MLTIAEVLRYSWADNFEDITGIDPFSSTLDELEESHIEHVLNQALLHPDITALNVSKIAPENDIADEVNGIAFNVLLDLYSEGEL